MKATHVTLRWRAGLHIRPATRLVRLAQRFKSRLFLKAGEHVADARSIFQILLLSASIGTTMIIEADGSDENEAVQAMTEFFTAGDVDFTPDVTPVEYVADFPEPPACA